MNDTEQNWDSLNYFNYFTEVEEHFQRARATSLFLLSPLDWALIEVWKDSGVPLEAVLRGIDEAFAKWRAKKTKTRMVNSLGYCAQEVLAAAQRMAGDPAHTRASAPQEPLCSLDELQAFIRGNIAALPEPYSEIRAGLERTLEEAAALLDQPQELDQRLTVLEEKMIAIARMRQSEREALEARQRLETELRSYRGRMTTDQLKMLRDQFLDRLLLEKAGLPRLSLFYLR